MRQFWRRIRRLVGPRPAEEGGAVAGERPAQEGRPKVTLYLRPMCPLCDEAKDLILDVARDIPLDLEEFDITSDLEVYERYKWKIPVVAIEGQEALVSIIKETLLREALKRFARS